MDMRLIGAGLAGACVGGWFAWAATADRADRRIRALEKELEIEIRAKREAIDQLVETRETLEAAMEAVESLGEVSEKSDILVTPQDEAQLELDLEKTPGEDSDETEPDSDETEPESDELTPEEEAQIEEERTNLQSLIDQYVPTGTDNEQFADTLARRVVESARQEPPFVISAEDYAWDEEGADHHKETLTFYPIHRILIDADEEVISPGDVESLIGWRNLNRFGDESGNADTVYIRNRRLDVDYEVVREEDEEPPLHVALGMGKEDFKARQAAGLLRFREEDGD